MKRRFAGWIALGLAASLGLAAAGCADEDTPESKKAMEERAKEIEKRMKDSMPKTQEKALAQKADPAAVNQVQHQLNVLKEYLDEPSGKIDFVTVNAIEAFQRHVGFTDDGLLDENTRRRLAEEATAVEQGKSTYWPLPSG
jgi:peptidoglycan hydrolase-like protein with peptidoglycan-binding domain